MIHKISDYKVRVFTGSVENRWLGGSFLIVYRNKAGRLGSGFISVCSETRWLGQKSGLYVPERPCKSSVKKLAQFQPAVSICQFLCPGSVL